MFQNLAIFRTAQAMAVHAGNRQAVVARNIANADTPGYKARDLPAFRDVVRSAGADSPRATRAGHLMGTPSGAGPQPELVARGTSDPNGNSVSLELEMVEAAGIRREHDRALAIYRSSLNILRTSIGRR